MADVLWIKRQRLSGAVSYSDNSWCTTDAGTCCGTPSDCLPTGTLLKREFRRLYLPDGAILGPTWCEDITVCCNEGSGAGLIETTCCATPLPRTIRVTLNGTCPEAGSFDLPYVDTGGDPLWQYSPWLGVNSSIEITCNTISNELELTLTFAPGDSYTAPITDLVCDPLSGKADLSLAANASVAGCDTATIGEGTSSDSGCIVRVTKQRIYLPPSVTIGEQYCIEDPDACCEEEVATPCGCPESYPSTLYAVISNVTGCDALEGIAIEMSYDSVLQKWQGCYVYASDTAVVGGYNYACDIRATVECDSPSGFIVSVFAAVTVFAGSLSVDTLGCALGFTNVSSSQQFDHPCGRAVFWENRVIDLDTRISNLDGNGGSKIYDCCGVISFDLTVIE